MLVLKLLENKPKYGYLIIQELKAKSGGTFLLKDGTLYPILYRLEDERLVACRWSKAEGKQVPRKYYEITEMGRQALAEMENIWQSMADGVSKIMREADNDG